MPRLRAAAVGLGAVVLGDGARPPPVTRGTLRLIAPSGVDVTIAAPSAALERSGGVAMSALQVTAAAGRQWLVGSGLASGDAPFVDGLDAVRSREVVRAVRVEAGSPRRS